VAFLLQATLRMQADMEGIEIPENAKLEMLDKDALMNFNVVIRPTVGYWSGGE
jgi:hypothetical protein